MIEKGRIVVRRTESRRVKLPGGTQKKWTRAEKPFSQACGICTPISSRSNGGRFIWRPALTTVRDVGNEFEFITAVRDAVANGRGLGPRLLLAGIVDGTGPSAIGVAPRGHARASENVDETNITTRVFSR